MLFYELVGKVVVSLFIIINILALFFILLGSLAVRRNKLIIPRVLLFILDTFYFQIKRIASKFGMKEETIDRIGVELKNHVEKSKFSRIPPEQRIVVLPQCLRNPKCPARLDPNRGIICRECGLCIIAEMKRKIEAQGSKFFIVPGSSFVYRIVQSTRPKAAFGVACPGELYWAMHELSKKGIAVQGVPLLKSGCVGTEVDICEIYRVLGIEEDKSINARCSSKYVAVHR